MFHHSQPPPQQGPPLPPPWESEWDPRQNCPVYINRQTGQRTTQHPQSSYGPPGGGYGGGYGGGGGGGGGYPPQGGYGGGGYPQPQAYGQPGPGGPQVGYGRQPPPAPASQHSGVGTTAMTAIGGAVFGALATHEGEKLYNRHEAKERYEEGYRPEGYGERRGEYREGEGGWDRERREDERRGEYGEPPRWERREEERREERQEEREDEREEQLEERREDYEERREERYEERREERYDDDY